ncbi:MAG TPA: type I-U CRISPR-associated helicase/endonuclease Cas3, partial [Acidobacteriaceae bacterium]|nr:type I-U CRISPR-associated helicase/endonuclease Cas3 [Acidobacteriaceae bacterium]
MARLFLRLTNDWYPRLVDLPTGTGKTDVVTIWVLALAWCGLDRTTAKPVPRRLVWVVNRRVLVQQVFRLADRLQEKLNNENTDDFLADVRAGLAHLSGDVGDLFRVVQLRGQLVDDREWSVAPSVPQLIIGTVDQIGSRLLFQGYSLGKWSRPLQAALLTIDAWICVDEAHLVPAFVLTLRQLAGLIPNHRCSPTLSSVFDGLPFWTTELSATPALPPPKSDSIFGLNADDEKDPRLSDRLLAARTRQVTIRWVNEDQKPQQAIQKAARDLAGKLETVAVFVREAAVANRIFTSLEKQFKGRVLKITGRLRGYERDRLERNEIFQRFRQESSSNDAAMETVFLVGTAAAEVGLDADSAAVICDFASLPTLLQRLGRLDRRGCVSRAFYSGKGEVPAMTIFAKRVESGDEEGAVKREMAERDIRRRVLKLAEAAASEENDVSVPLLIGKHWRDALSKETNHAATEDGDDDARDHAEAAEENGKPKGVDERAIVSAATWEVLLGRGLDQRRIRRGND